MSKPSSFLSCAAAGLVKHRTGHRSVIAVRPILAGELVAVLGGEIVPGRSLHVAAGAQRRVAVQIEDDLFLRGAGDGPVDWINHSCDPNLGLRGQQSLVALADLGTGQALTLDYATACSSPYAEFECTCGAPSCRGLVSATDWMRADLMDRDRRHFAPYLRRRIARFESTLAQASAMAAAPASRMQH